VNEELSYVIVKVAEERIPPYFAIVAKDRLQAVSEYFSQVEVVTEVLGSQITLR
jgi:hypothetical protein